MKSKINIPSLALITLMALTRVHHFGDSFSLPDASLAVFFLAGFCLNSRALFVLLLIEAGLVDYLAIHHFAVSDWCISPAYVFLIPTYAVLWLAGRYSTRFNALNRTAFGLVIIIAAAATTAAFIISNLSFYLFSGRYTDLAFSDYSTTVAQYYLPYLTGAMVYSLLGLAIIKIIMLLPHTNIDNKIA